MSSGRNLQYDAAVIGGGSAGYAAARTLAGGGRRVAVVEGGAEVGGLCILRGCMPTKAILQSAEVLHLVKRASAFGIQSSQAAADFAGVMARKRRLIGEFASYRREQLESGLFDFIRAEARFTGPNTVALSTGQSLAARNFVLSTGSTVAPSPLPQLEQAGYWTSDDALSAEALPESLILLGGGAVAVEFAQFFARLGARVSMVQRSPHILREMDADAAAALETVLRREGIALYTGTCLLDAWRDGQQKGVLFEHNGQPVRLTAAEIFFGLGRVPNTAGLNLGAAGVATEFGRIVTDARMRTSVEHIYAAGDCTGLHEIVHVAIQQGEVAAHNILHPEQARSMDYRLFTTVVFTEPQVGVVGLTEKAARTRGIDYLSASYGFADHGKSLIMEAADGFVKLLADPHSGEILGGAVVGPAGGELIHEIIAAMAKRMTVQELAAMPHYHPTLAEIWTYPAEELAQRVALRAGSRTSP